MRRKYFGTSLDQLHHSNLQAETAGRESTVAHHLPHTHRMVIRDTLELGVLVIVSENSNRSATDRGLL